MTFREEIAFRFKSQADFAKTYSPLYAKIFSLVGGWVESAAQQPNSVATWLLEASKNRNPFDVTLLLLAGLHEAVLANYSEVAELAQFYPTAGGSRLPTDPTFSSILKSTILNLEPHLTHVIQTATVQTNETGRGSAWLLPLAFTDWEKVDLLDLGASAGLNLVAEKRRFDFVAKESGQQLIRLGQAAEKQMKVETTGETASLEALSQSNQLPLITARYGVDLIPFPINTEADAIRLTSYIWADQPIRVERLAQALAIYQQVQHTDAPVQLDAVRLPQELPSFLNNLSAKTKTPLLIYNTYITQYFKSERPQLKSAIHAWARTQSRPILWVQWEPHIDWMDNGEAKSNALQAEEFGWCAWTADLWQNQQHTRFHLGWVHPHGLQARFLSGLSQWADHWT